MMNFMISGVVIFVGLLSLISPSKTMDDVKPEEAKYAQYFEQTLTKEEFNELYKHPLTNKSEFSDRHIEYYGDYEYFMKWKSVLEDDCLTEEQYKNAMVTNPSLTKLLHDEFKSPSYGHYLHNYYFLTLRKTCSLRAPESYLRYRNRYLKTEIQNWVFDVEEYKTFLEQLLKSVR